MQLLDGQLMDSAGGIRSNVQDLLTWGRSLLSTLDGSEPTLKGLDTVLSGYSFMNRTASSDELCALGFAKVTTPSQFGKIGFNAGLIDSMPVIEESTSKQVFYHSGGGTGYNHCYMIIPGRKAVLVVLTNSIAQGDTADWVAQTLLQAVLDVKSPVDLTSYAKKAANKWVTGYQAISDTLEKGRKSGTPQPPQRDLLGTFWHETGGLYIEVFESEGSLKFNFNGFSDQEHVLSHYHDDTFVFFPSQLERVSRGLFHYGPATWLLHFKRNSHGEINQILWNVDTQAPEGDFQKGQGRCR
ncbi:hypothetical protein QBC44DRAFT_242466 [Cladorrhinum sp. PSN332]|nr:hypothetical protein QBC44DRAFT_242466 [Cladorrhinum sp. PSN332]